MSSSVIMAGVNVSFSVNSSMACSAPVRSALRQSFWMNSARRSSPPTLRRAPACATVQKRQLDASEVTVAIISRWAGVTPDGPRMTCIMKRRP